MCDSYNFKSQILNREDLIDNNCEIIIINSLGVLNEFYKYASGVFIGKSILKVLEKDGGQNPIDAAKLNCKIYHGPYVYNFSEIYEILNNLKISKQINSPEELSAHLEEDIKNPKKLMTDFNSPINDLSGETLKITMRNINKFLLNEAI